MAKWGFIGAALGTVVGIAAAPFTGGASLGLLAAGGALAGSTIGSQIDSSKAAKKGERLAKAQIEENRGYQERVRQEQTKASALLAKEKAKVDQGIVRAMRRKFKQPSGFLIGEKDERTSGVLG